MNIAYVLRLKNVTQKGGKSLKKRLHLYLPEFSSGGLMGVMTTFALLTAASGARFTPNTLLFLGTVNLLANGLAFSLRAAFLLRPRRPGTSAPSDEEAWVRRVLESRLRAQGLQSGTLQRSIAAIMELPEFTQGKVHFPPQSGRSPLWAALATLLAFTLLGAFPLAAYSLTYLCPIAFLPLFLCSTLMVGLAVGAISWINSLFPNTRPWRLLRENLLLCLGVGGLALGLGQFITYLF